MATIEIDLDTVHVRLTTAEKIFALRGDVAFPRTAVREVEVLPDGLAATHGTRVPGLGVPGVRNIGTWRRPGVTEFVSVRRGEPASRITLVDQRYDAVLVSCTQPEALAQSLRE
ncbi:hypothetical protein SAMN05443287_1212 [Micromonospora phaseoli]|uniref:Bacterial Pleckstrin homology domain-containing protein n=1 Tax=Micromonospora phaseoli TaxID=1144548 RepID=A0A1H7E6W1_9ACTN|nr:hypothetical protein [Micromonospora phaseoli]PZV89000.1 hypothetical protein CLV64_11731 [Micromonospora phaseoli]GIJ80994.1 hypothetical protein Xph01_54260 [Micromonospora phaseoli]SEK06345.1 hypothetical protein SAMN05443287_1212 [Micromonospora phaseoli]